LATDPIPLRLIRVKLKSGEIEVLATLLLEEQTYPSTWFKHLYHLRWGNVRNTASKSRTSPASAPTP